MEVKKMKLNIINKVDKENKHIEKKITELKEGKISTEEFIEECNKKGFKVTFKANYEIVIEED